LRAVRAIWGKSRIQYADVEYPQRREDTYYVSERYWRMQSAHMGLEYLCRANNEGYGFIHIVSPEIAEAMQKWLAGERDNLRSKTVKSIAGPKQKKAIMNRDEEEKQEPQEREQTWSWAESTRTTWSAVQRPGQADDEQSHSSWHTATQEQEVRAPWQRQARPVTLTPAAQQQQQQSTTWQNPAWQAQSSSSSTSRTQPYSSWNTKNDNWQTDQ
jgi:hypothetical protein